MFPPAATVADSSAGDPGLLHARLGLSGSWTGRISDHCRWIVAPGLMVVNRS
jgi:hypothetical protein